MLASQMRFNIEEETFGLNYHPDHLQNLARSLGYGNYRVDDKRSGNYLPMVYIDSCGNFIKTTRPDSSIEKPYDITFWGTILGN